MVKRMRESDLFPQFFDDSWRLEADGEIFEYAAETYLAHRDSQDWMNCWVDLLARAPFFAEPHDQSKIDTLWRLQASEAGIKAAVAIYTDEGMSLSTFVLAERSGAFRLDHRLIPEWLKRSETPMVASIGLYALGIHAYHMVEARRWQELDAFLKAALGAIRLELGDPCAVWWNVVTALKIAFQAKNVGASPELCETMRHSFRLAAERMYLVREDLLARFSEKTPWCYDSVLIYMIELGCDEAFVARLLSVVLGRVDALRENGNYIRLPYVIRTYVDLHCTSTVAHAVRIDAQRSEQRQGWLMSRLCQAIHPSCDWDGSHDRIQQSRWALWLLTVGCVAILQEGDGGGDSWRSFVRVALEAGCENFLNWWMRMPSDDLYVASAEFFTRALVSRANEANGWRVPERLIMKAGCPRDLEVLAPLFEIIPPDAHERCSRHRAVVTDWWAAL